MSYRKRNVIRDMLVTGGRFFSVMSGCLWRSLTFTVVLTFMSERGVTYNNLSGFIILLAGVVWIIQPTISEFRTYVRYKEVSDVVGDREKK